MLLYYFFPSCDVKTIIDFPAFVFGRMEIGGEFFDLAADPPSFSLRKETSWQKGLLCFDPSFRSLFAKTPNLKVILRKQ